MLKLVQQTRRVGRIPGVYMNLLGRTAGIVAVSVLLTGCDAIGGGCSGVEMETEYDDYLDRLDVTIRNTSGEPKLVALASVGSDGSEINSQTIRVDAKDIAETAVGNMRSRGVEDVQLASCE